MSVTTKQDDEGLPFKINLDSLIGQHDMVWSDGLPDDWRLGAPIGNGDIGVVVHGADDRLSFTLGKTDVWQRIQCERDFLPGRNFAELRRAYLDNDKEAYDRLVEEFAAGQPQYSGGLPHLTTCGTVHLQGLFEQSGSARLSLLDGMLIITSSSWRVEAFVSRESGVLVVTVIPAGAIVPANIGWCYERADDGGQSVQEVRPDDHTSIAVKDLGNADSFAAGVMRPPCADKGAVRFLVTVASSREAGDVTGLCRERLARAASAPAQQVVENHRDWWQKYWMRGLAAVGDRSVEKWYYRSLYLCGSMLEPGKQSPGLQGAWIGELQPPWNADYHANVNIQAVYWGLMTNNRLDLMEPYLRLYTGFAEHGREVVRDYFGMRGLIFPFAASIDGYTHTSPGWTTLSVDPASSQWIAQLFWQYYEYSQDRDFLEKVAFPILRDCANFLVDYLLPDERTGRYTIKPSVHFETCSPGFGAWGDNSLYANTMFRLGWKHAILAASVLDVKDADVDAWCDRLENLAEPPINGDGLFKEWENRDLLGPGGHNFHLCMAFPGELVSFAHGPEKWLLAAKKTWQLIRDGGLKSASGGSWCGGQGACELHRIGEHDAAFKRAQWDAKQHENAFLHAKNGIIQVDHGPGMCRVLADMLLVSLDGVIHLFSGIPDDVPARFFSLRVPGGFLVSAEKRENKCDYAIISPTVPGKLSVANPWLGRRACLTNVNTGAVVEITKGKVLTAQVEPDQQYLLAPEGFAKNNMKIADFGSFAGRES